MAKIIVDCNLEDLDFVIKNLVLTPDQEESIKTVSFPIEIEEDEENYKFLCRNDKVLEWRFEKEDRDINLPENDVESLPTPPATKELEEKDVLENMVDTFLVECWYNLNNFKYFINALLFTFFDRRKIILGTDTWKYTVQNTYETSKKDQKILSEVTMKASAEIMEYYKETFGSYSKDYLLFFIEALRAVYALNPNNVRSFTNLMIGKGL